NFTPLVFYTQFLPKLANFYRESVNDDIELLLFERGDDDIFNVNYRIDPISTPLLLSIFEQLSKFHKKPLNLFLNNNHGTVRVLEFLFRSGFFDISRQDGILQFSRNYLGAFQGKQIRKEHIIRSYRKHDFPNV